MSHHLNSPSNTTIVQLGCPIFGTLIPNQFYLFTGLSQGTLGLFDVLTYALDNNTLSENVTIFPVGYTQGWEAHIDWTDCQLTFVHDNLDNRVYDKTNISTFPWFNPVVSNNFLDSTSSIVWTAIATTFAFQGNIIQQNSVLTLTSGAIIAIVDTVLEGFSFLTINANPLVSIVLFERTRLEAQSNVTINPTIVIVPTGNIEIRNTIFHKAQVNITSRNTHKLQDVTIHSSILTNNSGLDVLLENVDIRISSNVDFDVTSEGLSPLIIQNTEVYSSVLDSISAQVNLPVRMGEISVSEKSAFHITGLWGSSGLIRTISEMKIETGSIVNLTGVTSIIDFHNWVLTNQSIMNAAVAGTVTNISLESGVFSNASFNVLNARLENETTVLVANIVDATKSGYVNLLP